MLNKVSKFSILLNVGLIIVIAFMVLSPKTVSYGVSLNQYNQVEQGMSYADVSYIFKQDGIELSDSSDTYKVSKWQGKASKDSYCLITFVDDEVVVKVQEGLE